MANPSIQLGTNSNWAIKEDKLLAYKEYNDYFFNKEFDFSRGTSATYVAKDGLIKTAGIQPNIVNNGDFSELGSELVTNGDFATDSDWTKDSGWSIESGQAVCNGVGTNSLQQSGITTTGKIYKLSFDVLDSNNFNFLVISTNFADTYVDADLNNAVVLGTNTFYIKPTNGTGIRFRVANGATLSIDNVSVKQVDPNDYWTLGTYTSIQDSKAVITNSTGELSLSQNIGISQKTIKITYTISDYVSGVLRVQYGAINGSNRSANGTYSDYIEGSNTSQDLLIYSLTSDTSLSVSNISVQEIQTDTPRIDFTNDTKGHLLLEPSRTNLVTNSNDFSSYTFTNIDYNANNSISPDGSVNATKVTPNTSNAFHDLRTSANISLGSGNNTVSFFIKSNGYNFFELGVASNSGFSKYATAVINLNDGTNANTGVNQTWTITNVNISEFNSDWYRLELTFNVDTSTSTAMVFASSLPTSARGVAFQGDGTSGAYIYGLQLEEGDYSTSYIPTTGAASTRNADVCNNSGSAQDFNSEEGVLYAEIAALESTSSGSKFISISDGTYNNRASILFSNGATNKIRCFLRVGGTSQVDKIENVTDVTDFNKVAFSYKENEFKVFINGSQAGSTDTSGSVWSSGTITKLSLTEINSALGAFNGKVRNVQVFTEALTDAELQELTS